MKIITMATLKGGAGKTMNTFNIAGILATDYRVLLIDADPQCNLSNNVGVDIADADIKTIREIFNKLPGEQPAPEEIIFKNPIPELPNLDIIPSSIMLFDTEERMVNATGREHYLKYYIDDNKEYLESRYDYILIDTNPSISIININAFYVADNIILTSDVSSNGILGAELFCSLWGNKRKPLRKEDNISALIICNSDSRAKLGTDLVEYSNAADFSKDIVLRTVIPMSVKLKKTETSHKPINILFPKSSLNEIYGKIIAELKTRGVF